MNNVTITGLPGGPVVSASHLAPGTRVVLARPKVPGLLPRECYDQLVVSCVYDDLVVCRCFAMPGTWVFRAEELDTFRSFYSLPGASISTGMEGLLAGAAPEPFLGSCLDAVETAFRGAIPAATLAASPPPGELGEVPQEKCTEDGAAIGVSLVFNAPEGWPWQPSARFLEVLDGFGRLITGEWRQRNDGLYELRVPLDAILAATIAAGGSAREQPKEKATDEGGAVGARVAFDPLYSWPPQASMIAKGPAPMDGLVIHADGSISSARLSPETLAETEVGAQAPPAAEQPAHLPLSTAGSVQAILSEVSAKVAKAEARWPALNSAHEGYAVTLEEVDELIAEVDAYRADLLRRVDELKRRVWTRQSNRDLAAMRAEALDVAACAVRFVLNVCDQGRGRR